MCEFVSWIEKGEDILFLTGDDIFYTKRGRDLQKHCKDSTDLAGHGAIMWYFDIKKISLVQKECTDFSTPENFPEEIVKAIKAGKMRGLGVGHQLLTKPAYDEYEKIRLDAYAKYNKITQDAYAEYEKIKQDAYAKYEKIEQAAYAEYEKITQDAYDEYEKIRLDAYDEYEKIRLDAYVKYDKITQDAYAEYEKIKQDAYAEYEKITQNTFWDLFAKKSNRNPLWR